MDEMNIEIDYTNHLGERRKRKILPVGNFQFFSNQWHTKDQWLFNAIDLEDPDRLIKTFALAGIHGADDDARVTDLLKANNEYLERARNAEAREKTALTVIDELNAKLAEAESKLAAATAKATAKAEPATPAAEAIASKAEEPASTSSAPTPAPTVETASAVAAADPAKV